MSGFLLQFSWRKIFSNLYIYGRKADDKHGEGNNLPKSDLVKNISPHPGPPLVRCIAPDFLGLTSSVNSVATDPSKLPWKIISAISEDQFLKTDNITMRTHWTKCYF